MPQMNIDLKEMNAVQRLLALPERVCTCSLAHKKSHRACLSRFSEGILEYQGLPVSRKT